MGIISKRMCTPVRILTIARDTATATPIAMNPIITFRFILPWLLSSTSSVRTQIAGSAKTTIAPMTKPMTTRKLGLPLAIREPRVLATGINADSTAKRNTMMPKYE